MTGVALSHGRCQITAQVDQVGYLLLRPRKRAFGGAPGQQSAHILLVHIHDAGGADVLFYQARDALLFQAAMVHPRHLAMPRQVAVLHVGPALARGLQAFLCSGTVLATAAPFRGLAVVALEILFRVARDAVDRPFGIHDVRVRLLAFF